MVTYRDFLSLLSFVLDSWILTVREASNEGKDECIDQELPTLRLFSVYIAKLISAVFNDSYDPIYG